MDKLNHVLSHMMASNELVLENVEMIEQVLHQRTIDQCQSDEGSGGPVMHRWHLRLASLIGPAVPPPLRAIGFRCMLATYTASSNQMLAHSKQSLGQALNVVSSPTKTAVDGPQLFCSALDLAMLVIAKRALHPEWARENVGASVVQKLVQSLVSAANGSQLDIRLPSVHAIETLVPLFPTALRPQSASLHNLAVTLMCAESRAMTDAGAQIFGTLYLLAPKGRDGLRDAWKRGVEALIGVLESLTNELTQGIFAEDVSANHTLGPLSLPPLPSPAPPQLLLSRIDSLSYTLCYLLRTPTTERAGSVPVPIGALVELGIRLVSLNEETSIKERVDPALVRTVIASLGRLQIAGGRILATTATCVGQAMLPHASDILAAIANTLTTCPLRSPLRPALSATYSLVLSALGGAIDSEEGKKSLARVWRCVLEDISAVASTVIESPPSFTNATGDKRKAKKQKTYDPSESMTARRISIDEVDLDIAKRALGTLERLLAAPHSHFLPAKLRLSTSRLLLFLALDPAFFSTHPLPTNTSSSAFFPSTSATRGLDIARQDIEFRRGVLRALRVVCSNSGPDAAGLAERALSVWTTGSRDADPEIRALSIETLGTTWAALVHPRLPPMQVNQTFARQRAERVGRDVGDEIDVIDGANEFLLSAAQRKRLGGAGTRDRRDGMDVDDDHDSEDSEDEAARDEAREQQLREERRRKMEEEERRRVRGAEDALRREKEQADVSARGFGGEIAGGGAEGGFVSFAAPVAVTDDKVDEADEELEDDVPEFVQVDLPHVAVAGAGASTSAQPRAGEDDSSDDDDDEAMPTINVDSDDD